MMCFTCFESVVRLATVILSLRSAQSIRSNHGHVDRCAYVSSFTLVDALTRQDIGELPDVIHLNDYPAAAAFNIRVNVEDKNCQRPVTSVLVTYKINGTKERNFCEEYLPFTIFGDMNPRGTDITDYSKARYFRKRFPNATSTAFVRAIPFFQSGCRGRLRGKSKHLTFEIEPAHMAVVNTKAFEFTYELYDAVGRWLTGENTNETDLATIYGYPIGKWDVSKITDFSRLFSVYFDPCPLPTFCPPSARNLAAAQFNDDISMWNVSSAVTMSNMFVGAASFNGDLSHWDTSRVTNMQEMFSHASSFTADLSTWTVSRVTDMSGMFEGASAFSADLSNWDVSKVTDLSYMFLSASSFHADLSKWDLSSATDTKYMFSSAAAFHSDLSNWNVSRVSDMRHMFDAAYRFNADLSMWDVSNVKSMNGMFAGALSFDADLSNWDVSQVTDMSEMFLQTPLFNSDLSKWNVSRVADMSSMFYNATSFEQNLCEWGDRLVDGASVSGAFQYSGCPNRNDPVLSAKPPGPLCYTCL